MSRFVSAGTNEDPPERGDDWLRAQQEIETNRRRKEEEGRQEDGKSLYEILQANKAAKQEAFEESIRLKNQFRSLDDDEVDFLDSVLESTRAKDAEVRKETNEQLDSFRRQQEEAEKAARAEQGSDEVLAEEEQQWNTSGRKRKKGREKDNLRGVKLRRVSSATVELATEAGPKPVAPTSQSMGDAQAGSAQPETSSSGREVPSLTKSVKTLEGSPPATSRPTLGLGLGAYSSDED